MCAQNSNLSYMRACMNYRNTKQKTRKTIYDKSKTMRACAKILGGRSGLVTYYIIFRYGCRLRDPAKHNGQGDAKQYAHQADDFTV